MINKLNGGNEELLKISFKVFKSMKERPESQQTVDGGTEWISSSLGLFKFQAPRAEHGWRHAPSLLAVYQHIQSVMKWGIKKKNISAR